LKFLSVDYDLALELVQCCIQTYKQWENDGKFMVPANYSLVCGFKACAIIEMEWFGYVIENENSLIIAFRGTKSDLDWIADLKVEQELFPFAMNSGSVHSGFLSIYKSCREGLLDIVKERAANKKVYITGHSLGGSLATLFGFELAMTNLCTPNVYSFGAPKVGNKGFKEKYDEFVRRSIRFVNIYDVVPLSPPFKVEIKPLNLNLEYLHVQQAITFAINKGSISKSHNIMTYVDGVNKMKLKYDYTPTFTFKYRDEEEQLTEQTK